MYVLVTRDKALVIDTQTMADFEGRKIIDYVTSITDKPVVVVNTHPHRDHIAGNAQCGEAYLSAPAIEEVKTAAARANTPITFTMKPVKDGDIIDLGDRKIEVIAIPAHNGAPVTKRYIKYFMDLDAKIMAGTAPEVPIADGPNYDRWNDTMTRYREHFASVVYTKTVPTK
jgi:mRNA degradation ribonuclease J1/J2